MRGEWRDWTYAEYAKVPLENCHLLDEEQLLGTADGSGLGYSIENLAQLPRLLVPYGGLSDIKLKAGESIIIAPATGLFGGRAVEVALSMGGRVSSTGYVKCLSSTLLTYLGRCSWPQFPGFRETRRT